MNSTSKHRMFEGIRVATLVTFISGFINSFTFATQEGRFAGVQTGNLIYMMIRLAEGKYAESFSYILPILFFILGQSFVYFGRRWAQKKGYHWHFLGSFFLLILMLLIAFSSPIVSSNVTLAGLAFFASIQLDTFKKIRGVAYANVMMTGNMKNVAWMLTKALAEKDHQLLKKSLYTVWILISFMIGVFLAKVTSDYWQEYALYLVILPLVLINWLLATEKPHQN